MWTSPQIWAHATQQQMNNNKWFGNRRNDCSLSIEGQTMDDHLDFAQAYSKPSFFTLNFNHFSFFHIEFQRRTVWIYVSKRRRHNQAIMAWKRTRKMAFKGVVSHSKASSRLNNNQARSGKGTHAPNPLHHEWGKRRHVPHGHWFKTE